MRRKPRIHDPVLAESLPNLKGPNATQVPTTPASQADAIETFLVSGGQTFYLTGFPGGEGGLEPALDAVQLVTSIFVPPGTVGWIKRVMIAPCAPPFLVDPWRGWANTANYFNAIGVSDPYATTVRAPAQAGLWETPAAWEGYYDPTGFPTRPSWRWSLVAFPGQLEYYRQRQRIMPFNVLDASTWYLAPDVAVPAVAAYGAGAVLPGRLLSPNLPPQRLQAPPSSPLSMHLQIPENTTVCLFARWTQAAFVTKGWNQSGPIDLFPPLGGGADPNTPTIYPLLPSVGSLMGYTQPAGRPASAINAAHGWQG